MREGGLLINLLEWNHVDQKIGGSDGSKAQEQITLAVEES
jgi:hypothetical protein